MVDPADLSSRGRGQVVVEAVRAARYQNAFAEFLKC